MAEHTWERRIPHKTEHGGSKGARTWFKDSVHILACPWQQCDLPEALELAHGADAGGNTVVRVQLHDLHGSHGTCSPPCSSHISLYAQDNCPTVSRTYSNVAYHLPTAERACLQTCSSQDTAPGLAYRQHVQRVFSKQLFLNCFTLSDNSECVRDTLGTLRTRVGDGAGDVEVAAPRKLALRVRACGVAAAEARGAVPKPHHLRTNSLVCSMSQKNNFT